MFEDFYPDIQLNSTLSCFSRKICPCERPDSSRRCNQLTDYTLHHNTLLLCLSRDPLILFDCERENFISEVKWFPPFLKLIDHILPSVKRFILRLYYVVRIFSREKVPLVTARMTSCNLVCYRR